MTRRRTPPLTAEAVREEAALEAAQAALEDALLARQYLTCVQAATVIQSSASHVRREIQAGRLSAIPVGRHWRICPAQLRAYMTARAVTQRRLERVS